MANAHERRQLAGFTRRQRKVGEALATVRVAETAGLQMALAAAFHRRGAGDVSRECARFAVNRARDTVRRALLDLRPLNFAARHLAGLAAGEVLGDSRAYPLELQPGLADENVLRLAEVQGGQLMVAALRAHAEKARAAVQELRDAEASLERAEREVELGVCAIQDALQRAETFVAIHGRPEVRKRLFAKPRRPKQRDDADVVQPTLPAPAAAPVKAPTAPPVEAPPVVTAPRPSEPVARSAATEAAAPRREDRRPRPPTPQPAYRRDVRGSVAQRFALILASGSG